MTKIYSIAIIDLKAKRAGKGKGKGRGKREGEGNNNRARPSYLPRAMGLAICLAMCPTRRK